MHRGRLFDSRDMIADKGSVFEVTSSEKDYGIVKTSTIGFRILVSGAGK